MLRLGYVQLADTFPAGLQGCPATRVRTGSCEEHVPVTPEGCIGGG